jgi:hypothetical protein
LTSPPVIIKSNWLTKIEKTAFITRYGLFEHTRMGMGLCNAPATFQRAMQFVITGMIWTQVLVYINDIIVLGKNLTAHYSICAMFSKE